ncbi:MAG: AAA family ATPase [Chloroflexota bacterium]
MNQQTGARLKLCTIEGYKSIRNQIVIRFPKDTPLILVGENNSGKSNIISALDLLLGERWPGTREPEDHDFWGRDTQNGLVHIDAEVSGVYGYNKFIHKFKWICDSKSRKQPEFRVKLDDDTEKFVSNEIRDQVMFILIGPDRRLDYQLSYTNKFTFLSKLMQRFHSALTSDVGRVGRLKQAFDDLERIFREVNEFAQFEQNLSQEFGEMFAGMSYGLQVDFSAYDPSRFFHSLRVVPKEGAERRTFEELGTGQEQILALAFAHAYAKAFYGGIILAIEEPEAHLHPLAQEWLARKIHQMAADGLQIVITTHSPHFVDLMGLEGLVLVRKDSENATQTFQLTKKQLVEHCLGTGSHPKKTSVETILPFYANQSTQEILNGFFAKKIILVEGQTEQLALPVYFQKVGLDVTQEGIEIIPVLGKGNLAKWWRLFTAYGIPTYVIFDNDKQGDDNGTKRKDALKALAVDENHWERYLQTDEWEITPTFTVFGGDFETTMRQQFSNYSELEQEAKETLGESKPIIARYVANRLDASSRDDGWKKFQELKDIIHNLGNPTK